MMDSNIVQPNNVPVANSSGNRTVAPQTSLESAKRQRETDTATFSLTGTANRNSGLSVSQKAIRQQQHIANALSQSYLKFMSQFPGAPVNEYFQLYLSDLQTKLHSAKTVKDNAQRFAEQGISPFTQGASAAPDKRIKHSDAPLLSPGEADQESTSGGVSSGKVAPPVPGADLVTQLVRGKQEQLAKEDPNAPISGFKVPPSGSRHQASVQHTRPQPQRSLGGSHGKAASSGLKASPVMVSAITGGTPNPFAVSDEDGDVETLLSRCSMLL